MNYFFNINYLKMSKVSEESIIEEIKSKIKYFPEIRGYDNIEEKGSCYYNNANIVPLKDGNFIYFDQQNICRIYNKNFDILLHLTEIKEGNKFLFSPYCETVILPLSSGHIFSGGFFNSILEISSDYQNYKVIQKFEEKSALEAIEILNNVLLIFFHPNIVIAYKKVENLFQKENIFTSKIVQRKDNKIKKFFKNNNIFGIIYDNFIDIYNIVENSIEYKIQIKLNDSKMKLGKYFQLLNDNILLVNCYKDEVEEFEKNLDEVDVPGNFEEFFNFNKNQYKGIALFNLNYNEIVSAFEIKNIIHGFVKYDSGYFIILEEDKKDKYNSVIKVNLWKFTKTKEIKFIREIEEKEKNLEEFQSFENAVGKLSDGTIIYTLAYLKQ